MVPHAPALKFLTDRRKRRTPLLLASEIFTHASSPRGFLFVCCSGTTCSGEVLIAMHGALYWMTATHWDRLSKKRSGRPSFHSRVQKNALALRKAAKT